MARNTPTIPAVKPVRSKRPATPSRRSGNSAKAESASGKNPEKSQQTRSKAKAAVTPKIESTKLERGRFSMPAVEFSQIATLKGRALSLGRPAKKNELLRIGLSLAAMLADEALVVALDQLEPIKTAKPKKRKPSERADS